MRRRTILTGIVISVVITCAGWYVIARTGSLPERFRGPKADHIIVEKAAHRMRLLRRGQVIRAYRVALGRGGLAPKLKAGDKLVPEGRYHIVSRNPNSAYHLSLRIGYPTKEQVAAARQRGIDPGGDIMIHGLPNGFGGMASLVRRIDWTLGCIAVSNEEIEEIWRLVPDGVTIDIRK